MQLNAQQIQQIIPHRYPFLLIDQVLSLEPEKKAIGIKNVSVNEPFFQGHFPDYPVMPGVLIVEAMAQLGAVVLLSADKNKGKLAFFTGIDKVRFRHQVKPGDSISIEVEILRLKRNIGKGKGIAKVQEKIVAEGEFMFAIS